MSAEDIAPTVGPTLDSNKLPEMSALQYPIHVAAVVAPSSHTQRRACHHRLDWDRSALGNRRRRPNHRRGMPAVIRSSIGSGASPLAGCGHPWLATCTAQSRRQEPAI